MAFSGSRPNMYFLVYWLKPKMLFFIFEASIHCIMKAFLIVFIKSLNINIVFNLDESNFFFLAWMIIFLWTCRSRLGRNGSKQK